MKQFKQDLPALLQGTLSKYPKAEQFSAMDNEARGKGK